MNALDQLALLVRTSDPDAPDHGIPAAPTAAILPDDFYSWRLLREIAVTALTERRAELAVFLLELRRLADLSTDDFVAEAGLSLPELHIRAGFSPSWAPEFVGLELALEEWPEPPASAQAELLDRLCASAALGDADANDLLSRLIPVPVDLQQFHLNGLLRLQGDSGNS